MEEVKSFLLMIQFMTRIPINKALPCQNKNFKKASAYIPLIGIIVGMSQFIVYKLLLNLISAEFLSVIMIIVYVFITGGFHLDGLGDTCDGFFAFKGGKDKIIEIMKDSRVGTYSTIAVIIDVLIRYIAYVKIINMDFGYIIILAPFIGRISLALLAYIGKGAKEEGSGNLIINNISNREMGIIFIMFIVFSYVTSEHLHVTYEILLLAICCVITLSFYKLCKDKIDGITGDNLGAINEIVELVALIFLLSI
ncbi:cobalamin synthase [Clostridium putrefaciens]|uniref:Adenosylcobinamide-GDP ribazoletransferase n=1 Tax=Clostridium putrefaciens TaxID=99675 RepID=A0A381J7I3_9CLOT|nr:adenosylcobinamide-GDP ribazoletransferase [Clostridium putrefaciens]SUY46939.1 cobalamin synthase [Clostridium putrefaciens]